MITAAREIELRAIFATGKRGEVIAAGEECLKEIERQRKRRDPSKGPTLAECITYAQEIGLSMDEATAFYDHHDTYGWKGKKGPYLKWEGAMRTWKRNSVRFARNGVQKPANYGVG